MRWRHGDGPCPCREAEGRTESADKTPDPSRVPSGWEASATTNRVRMLVLNDKTSENRSSPAERMSLRTDTTLEITRGREQACLFRVDEYLECAGSDKLYSVTLAELRRKFLSGVNVAVLVSGSESALPVGWRAVREVVWCIFRDVGDGCELFASAALVQHGLTQDLLSGCGRMTRTAVVSVPPLQPMLENVDYVKLSDARHFSSLLVRSLGVCVFGGGARTRLHRGIRPPQTGQGGRCGAVIDACCGWRKLHEQPQ
ncbi:hypothetical protein ERJ75_000891900 [Trypanosoma vivax]|nr:hypothetical protein ERJ75_000891900 [Trypanosoma vivax]